MPPIPSVPMFPGSLLDHPPTKQSGCSLAASSPPSLASPGRCAVRKKGKSLFKIMSELSPVLKVATVLGGIIAPFVAMKVGQAMIRLLFGLIGLAVLGGAVWWFLLRL